MDDERFLVLYRLIKELSPPLAKRYQYSDGYILIVYLWSVVRGKPVDWACNRRNAPKVLRGHRLPSESRMSRRLKTPSVAALLQLAILTLQQRVIVASSLVGCWKIDAKGFAVNAFSKDKSAKRGYCAGGKARGYKLFLLIDAGGFPVAWFVDSMNVAEQAMAMKLLAFIDRPGYLLGDSIYDSNDLYESAGAQQLQLVAPRKTPTANIGARARSAYRIHAIDMLETPCADGQYLYNARTQIERCFAKLASEAVGLDHLPGFVRTPKRVKRWIDAKMLLAFSLEI
jgi:hypothetical protein